LESFCEFEFVLVLFVCVETFKLILNSRLKSQPPTKQTFQIKSVWTVSREKKEFNEIPKFEKNFKNSKPFSKQNIVLKNANAGEALSKKYIY
jgi:hypothetical protein